MKILSSIISHIWNTVTFMDKEQRALVAHVLTVSQAHPKSFNYRNQTGRWESKGLKITFDKAHNEVFLSEVKYKLGWRANAILARHFAMLHICLHHEHIGKALSDIDIDKVENEPEWATDIDLTKWIGKMVDVKMRNGDGRNRVNIDSRRSLMWNVSLGCTPYTQEGRYYDKGTDGRDIVAIKLSI